MVSPEPASLPAPAVEPAALDEKSTAASGTRWIVATRPATVGATWLELFHPGTPSNLSLEARVRVVADVTGALIQIHENSGVPRQHRRHGRLTPRHVLVGVDGSASLFNAREPFAKLVPPQPDLGYLAPELLTQSGPAGQESDIFSLGVLLWEALDNGRLFPHRRAAAISRLIARRALPAPRIQEEWALPLGDVALRALSQDIEARYPDASAFWLALREHLPAPDGARAALSRLVQSALKLELTAEIRDAPPYVVPSLIRDGSSAPPRSSSLDQPPVEASERYSLKPEPSSRRPGQRSSRPGEDPAWTLSDPPPPSSRPAVAQPQSFLELHTARPPATKSELVPKSKSLLESEPSLRSELVEPRASRAPSPVPPSAEGRSDSDISTLHVNLPRDLIDASLPFYVPSQAAPRPFPWGALSFAALMFFGVGAAVAFGAVTAFRNVSPAAPLASSAPAPAPLAAEPTPRLELPAVATGPAPATRAVATVAPAPAQPVATGTEPLAPAAEPFVATPKASTAPAPKPRRAPKPARVAKPKAEASPEAKPEGEAAPAPEAPAAADNLPFVQQPY
jgi:hypothetical protein